MLQLLAAALLAIGLAGCAAVPEDDVPPPLFNRLPPERTGMTFVNHLAESANLNILNYLYYYNGGGVAVGDVNRDGLPDLYFTANEGPNKLYLNRGDFHFEDMTEAAGVAGACDWTTGVTMADVNADGRLDIYVSCVSGYLGLTGRNQLFINKGDGTFTDRAAAYGLDFKGFSTQVAFFDYDLDGDLDAYLLNHSVHSTRSFGNASLRLQRHPRSGDRLYRNDEGHFTNVSEEAGIYGGAIGYGLSISVSDFNLDGWPDLYVANDFHENDYLYINNGNGTFSEIIEEATGHTSEFSMGTDAADVNHDGWPDLVVLDMLPRREAIYKTSASAGSYDVYQMKRRAGYHHQLARNTLLLNQGGRHFSDIGLLAGVAATDWSWSALLADLDNDGAKDLYITNGIYRRPNDLDYIKYVSNKVIQRSLAGKLSEEDLAVVQHMPQIPIPNYAFRNDEGLSFTDVSAAWGLAAKDFSNGAAYGDLDNDGDLDLVVNNINAPAGIYENRADSLLDRHYLRVRLRGSGANTFGIGAKVVLWNDGQMQMQEQFPVRGWLSSVEPRLHFGVGDAARIDSLVVIWPDGRYQTLTDVATDQEIALKQRDARGSFDYARFRPDAPPLFADVTDAFGLDYRHEENTFNDFTREPLMPHKLSTEGPALAVGDVDGDGRDDFYVGGAKYQPGRLYVQQPDGRFAPTNEAVWRADRLAEDTDAAFFHADGDGDLDLYVVSGGNEFWGEAEALKDRIYFNDGHGNFRRAEGALPDLYANGGTVAPGDYDGDGDLDLFVGSRVVAREYGRTPPSYLLENDGTGRFTDVTQEAAPVLAEAGMVSDAVWTDYNGDDRLDLVVVGEWMPVSVFENRGGRLVEQTDAAGLGGTSGWWNTVAAVDLDGDGDEDLVAGNLGLNSRLHAGADEPARLYLNDFDENGSMDPILTYYKHGTSYPMATRDALIQAIAPLKQKFPTYADFGAAQMEDLFTEQQLENAEVHETYTFITTYIENEGNGTFTWRPLPPRAQFAPIFAILPGDFNGDGTTDLLLGGNFFGVKPAQGRYDASYGLFLEGDGRGRFDAAPPYVSGLWLKGAVRDLALIRRSGGPPLIVVARNNAPLQVVRPLRGRPPRDLPLLSRN